MKDGRWSRREVMAGTGMFLGAGALGPIRALGQSAGPSGAIRTGPFEGSPSCTLSSGQLELTFLPGGASIASIILLDDPGRMNPLWNPVRMRREAGQEAKPSAATGHMFCLDGFGPPSAEEQKAGLPFNGEATRQHFALHSSRDGATTEAVLTGVLPIAQENVTRRLRLVDGEKVAYIETEVESLLGFDRPAIWGEHATIGSPFLEPGVTIVHLSAGRCATVKYQDPVSPTNPSMRRRLLSGQEFQWPFAPALDGTTVDMSQAPENPHYIDHTATQMDPAHTLEFVTALNPKHRLLLGYLFRREEFPWLQTWGRYPSATDMARGMEFATQPFSLTRRAAVTQGTMFGTPMYRWLPAKSVIRSGFVMFYTQVPEGFSQVDDVRLENGQIAIEDHRARKHVRLTSSLGASLFAS